MLAPPTTQKKTLAEFLEFAQATESPYELVDGALLPMGIGSGLHGAIIKFLERQFDQHIENSGNNWVALSQGAVAIQSPRGGRWETARIPDLVILEKEQWRNLQNQEAIVTLDQSPPVLVVEVVSESTKSTDYRAKRSEYAVLNIPEYWIVDPLLAQLTILTLVEGWYEPEIYSNADLINSQQLENLALQAGQIFTADL